MGLTPGWYSQHFIFFVNYEARVFVPGKPFQPGFTVQAHRVIYTALYYLRNLRIGPISYIVCPWQHFPALGNVTLQLIEPIHKLTI